MFRVRLLLGGGLLCALAMVASVASAADTKEGEHGERHVKAKGVKNGKAFEEKLNLSKPEDIQKAKRMLEEKELAELITEQDVNLMEIRWDLGLWTIVVFVLLFLILRKMAWGPMLEGLHKREESILDAINEAEKARAEAKTLHDQFEKKMAEIGDKSRELMDEARRSAQRLQEEMLAKAKGEINAERERVHREIEMAKGQTIKELSEHAAMLATLISAKVIKRDLGVEDHRRLVDDAVAELAKTVRGVRQQAWSTNS
jgi:F-type H+-transporting ATPase subunit b